MILNVAARVVCLVVLSALPFGCSKAPTVVLLTVSADATVPPVASIRVTLVQPKGNAMRTFRSLLADTDAGAEPFVFPAPIEFLFSDGVDDEETPITNKAKRVEFLHRHGAAAQGFDRIDEKARDVRHGRIGHQKHKRRKKKTVRDRESAHVFSKNFGHQKH